MRKSNARKPAFFRRARRIVRRAAGAELNAQNQVPPPKGPMPRHPLAGRGPEGSP